MGAHSASGPLAVLLSSGPISDTAKTHSASKLTWLSFTTRAMSVLSMQLIAMDIPLSSLTRTRMSTLLSTAAWRTTTLTVRNSESLSTHGKFPGCSDLKLLSWKIIFKSLKVIETRPMSTSFSQIKQSRISLGGRSGSDGFGARETQNSLSSSEITMASSGKSMILLEVGVISQSSVSLLEEATTSMERTGPLLMTVRPTVTATTIST